MTPSQRKYLLMVRDEVNKRLNDDPGYFERARRLCKQFDLFNGVTIKVVDVPEDDCVGLLLQYQPHTAVHRFWLNPKVAKCEIRAIKFSGTAMILSIHFNA